MSFNLARSHARAVRPAFVVLVVLAALAPRSAHAQLCDGISVAAASPLTTVRVASGLSRPLFITSPPGDTSRQFILEQDGRIRILKDGVLLATPFLDVGTLTRSPIDGGGNEEGLLGLAFHPQYATNRYFFVYHTDSTGANNVVARYQRSVANADVADTASRTPVISFAHPTNTNHNGGNMAFGPDDGYLYIGTGDGGGGCDLNNNAQTLTSNLGKLLRINVNALPYTIPPDNPYVGVTGNDEVWSYGLRNPWRWSFDRANSDLYIGDVGQGQWEEIDWRAGTATGRENYGWRNYEGNVCPNPSCPTAGTCSITGHVPPIYQYGHSAGACSITGGYVYRGCRMPALAGTYFFADYCAAFIRSIVVVNGTPTNEINRTSELAPGGGLTINSINSFGEDARGEMFIVDGGGEVFKIVPVLNNLEVSGRRAQLFLLGTPANPDTWSWEDLQATSSHPIAEYRVYRSPSRGNGTFDCIFRTTSTTWSGGDLATPPPGAVYSYLVTARNTAGVQTSPGTGTSGQPRTLSTLACP